MWAKQNAIGKGSIKYPKIIKSNLYTYSVMRLKNEEEAMIASAFLMWRKTWTHNGFGWNIDYQAAKDSLKRSDLKPIDYIDILMEIKEAWLGAQYK